MLRMALFDCAINEKCCNLTEDEAFALFFRPHPGGFDSSRVPTLRNLPSKAKKLLMPWGQLRGVLGAGGIDWCIILDTSLHEGCDPANFNANWQSQSLPREKLSIWIG